MTLQLQHEAGMWRVAGMLMLVVPGRGQSSVDTEVDVDGVLVRSVDVPRAGSSVHRTQRLAVTSTAVHQEHLHSTEPSRRD